MSFSQDLMPQRALRWTVAACMIAAGIALTVGIFLGQGLGGAALAFGLLLGAANGFLADRMLAVQVSYLLSSMGRLAFFTVTAIAFSFVIGWRLVWLVLLGLGLAQFLLVGMAASQALRR